MTLVAIRLDRSSRPRRVRLGPPPKLPTAAMHLYRVALRKALERQQAKLWAIIEANYEEPKRDSAVTVRIADGALDPEPYPFEIRLLAAYIADCKGESIEALDAKIDALFRKLAGETHLDAAADGGASRLKSVHIDVPTAAIETAAERVAKKTRSETDRLLGVQVSGSTGKALRRVKGGISRASQGADKKVLDAFRKKNTDLIKSLEKQQVRELRSVLEEATEKGWHVARLRAEVKGRFDVTKSHADLIARDQCTKLNADLTRMRHKAAGIKRFRWSTSKDERVRESHAELDGEEFSYDDLPEVDGEKVMPGEPVCCRCVAIAIVDWLEDE